MVAFISKVFLIVSFCFGSLAAQNDLILKKEGSSQTADKKEKVKRVDKEFAIDKLQHFSYSCLISLGCQYVLVNKYDNSESKALPISMPALNTTKTFSAVACRRSQQS